MIAIVVLLAIASPFLLMALYVDDWSRDLTTNTAATSAGAADRLLQPITLTTDAEALARALGEFCRSKSAWDSSGDPLDLPADSPLRDIAAGGEAIHLVRTTGVMRYRDDVWVVGEDVGEGRLRVHAESRSRVGKGDLGQNPRNLKELLAGLRERLPASER